MGTMGPGATAAPQPEADADALAPPEDVTLATKDGVELHLTFYAGSQGKDAVPIVLLHGAKSSRKEYRDLAAYLQELGHAVVAVDLRGFGDSTHVGNTDSITADKLRPADYAAMAAVGGDLETVKKFLLKKHNAGELNIDKLCLVGADLGASVALAWAQLDWSWPVLFGQGKQGQDVKALVLISPESNRPGVPAAAALKHPAIRSQLSILVIAGKRNAKSLADAKRMHSTLERFHPAPTKEEEAAKKDLFLITPETNLAGMKMLSEGKNLGLEKIIAAFVQRRLVDQDLPWQERKSKL